MCGWLHAKNHPTLVVCHACQAGPLGCTGLGLAWTRHALAAGFRLLYVHIEPCRLAFIFQPVCGSDSSTCHSLLKLVLSTFRAHDEHGWLPSQACQLSWPGKAQPSFRAARSPACAGSRCAWRQRSAGTSTLTCAATCGGTRGALSVRSTLQALSSSAQPSSRSVTRPCIHQQRAAGALSDGAGMLPLLNSTS